MSDFKNYSKEEIEKITGDKPKFARDHSATWWNFVFRERFRWWEYLLIGVLIACGQWCWGAILSAVFLKMGSKDVYVVMAGVNMIVFLSPIYIIRAIRWQRMN